MKLGKLIHDLEKYDPEAHVTFDFGGFTPTGNIDSYRGYYDQLALAFDNIYSYEVTVGMLLKVCKEAVGATFTGYKGGEYTMKESTEVWVANYGESTGTSITHLTQLYETLVMIHTEYVE